MNVEIVPSTISHAKELTLTMRQKDREEALAMGLNPKKAVFYAYRNSLFRRTALIDGKVAAMWGVVGNLFGGSGKPYLITSTEVEKMSPIAFARIYREQVKKMSKLYPVLSNIVHDDYDAAKRMLVIGGFDITEPFPIDSSGHLFREFYLRTESNI